MRRAHKLLEQTLPPQSAAGTLTIIEEASRAPLLLLLQRSQKVPLPFTWTFPGGHIEEGETPYQAALRETWEELHIDMSAEHSSFSFTQALPLFGEKERTFTTFVYRLPQIPSAWSPHIDEESIAFGWFSPEAIGTVSLHPGMTYALKRIGWS